MDLTIWKQKPLNIKKYFEENWKVINKVGKYIQFYKTEKELIYSI